MPADVPFFDGNIYVTGAFNAWDKTQNNMMVYNFDKFEYQLKLLLKQGYFNYSYTKLAKQKYIGDSEIFEGNHYQTENDYLILVYHNDYIDNYDQLIGYKKVNSRK